MSEPAGDLQVSGQAFELAVQRAIRGMITHLTIDGKRVAAVVPESTLDEISEVLRAAEDAEDAAEAETAVAEPGESIPWEQIAAEFRSS